MSRHRVIAFTLTIFFACAALALAYQQVPLAPAEPFSSRPLTREKFGDLLLSAPRSPQTPTAPQPPSQSLDAQAMQERILKLEAKVAQLDQQIQEMQKPRIQPLSERNR